MKPVIFIVSSKATTYSQAVQRNKSSYNKYETIVKILIQLEPGYWQYFINKMKASLDTTRAAAASTTSVDIAENKEESSTQTQTRLGKTDAEKTEITPNTRPIKHPITKSSSKIRSKDKRSPIRPLASTDSSLPPKKKHQRQTKTYTETKNTRNRKYWN